MQNMKSIEQVSDTQKGKNLTFEMDNETYGLEIKFVRQIIGVQKVTNIPNQPAYLKGVINLRGEIIPIMDIRLRFGKQEIPYDDRTCTIILDVDGLAIGIIVDRVSEVITLEDENISNAPEFNDDLQNKFVRGIGKINERVYILLNCSEIVKHSTKK